MNKKKILFISGLQLAPAQSGGQIRSYSLCKALADQGHQVQIYSFTGRKEDYKSGQKSSNKELSRNLNEHVNRGIIYGLIQFIFYRMSLPPIWLTFISKFYLDKKLKKFMAESQTIILDFPFLYPLTQKSSGKVILNTHNAEFQLYKKDSFIANYVKQIEEIAIKSVDQVIYCCEDDQKVFSKIKSNSTIVPNGVDVTNFVKNEEIYKSLRAELNIGIDKKVILFTGSQYHPNIEAFAFLRQWSQKHKGFLIQNDILILVVGTVSQKEIKSPVFWSMGRVESIFPYFHISNFAINPVISGSGANVKMMEFIAAKLPLFTTDFGARGLNLTNSDCILFSREELLDQLNKNINKENLDQLATNAYNKNENIINMAKAIQRSDIIW